MRTISKTPIVFTPKMHALIKNTVLTMKHFL